MELLSLEYQTPRAADSPLRQRACQCATKNGGGLLFFSVIFMGGSWVFAHIAGSSPAYLVTGGIAAWYWVGGIIYVIAGAKIIRPDPFWERVLVVSSAVHAIVCAGLGFSAILFLVMQALTQAVLGTIASVVFLTTHWIVFGRMIYLAVKVHKES